MQKMVSDIAANQRQDVLDHKIADKTVFRRNFEKADGRMLYLYGYEPHKLKPIESEESERAAGGELRHHPLRQEWNVYAPHRQNRTFKPSAADDPLAPTKPGGPETEIPFEHFELAVFENKFTSLHDKAVAPEASDIVEMAASRGHCDVVVYGPEAEGNLHSIGQDRRRLLLAAWTDRYQSLFAQGHEYVLPFENRGDEVGVTLHHPHGQIYAFPFVPGVQAKAVDAFAKGYNLAADIQKFKDGYEIANSGGMSAFCPPYTRFPYEVWIAPEEQLAGPWAFNEEQSEGFAQLLGEVTRKYDALFERPTPYMLSLHAAPRSGVKGFHFTAQFYPLLRSANRVKYLASVEQSTGVFTVDVMPEFAAKSLRDL